jgi:Lipid A 3-O-deacylase (PagL)
MKRHPLCFLLLFLCQFKIGIAQLLPEYQLGYRQHYGFILAHVPSLQGLSNAHFPMAELTLTKLTHGNKDWQQAYNNPDLGLSLLSTSFANNKVLGRGYALIPNISFHYLRKKWLQANFRFGAGFSYIEKPFDRLTNYKNNAIGSHINSAISVMLETKYKLSQQTNLGIGLALTHFSNGAMQAPNLGINIATANIAFAYQFNKKEQQLFDTTSRFKKHMEYFAVAATGIKEIAPAGGDKYSVVTASFNIARVRSIRGKWGAGIDVMHDASIHEQNKRDSLNTSQLSVTQAGLNVSWEVTFGKLSFPLQAGIYLYSNYKGNGILYNRYGIRYHFHKNIFANFSLKTHYAKADYFEWGFGYRFSNKKR